MSGRSATTPEAHFDIRRGGASRGLLWYGLIAPPLVWAAELYLNYGLASHACFPGRAPRASFLSGWERVWAALMVVNLVCLAVAAIGLVTSAFSWRRLRDEQLVVERGEAGGIAYPSGGRLRAFAASGLMVSGLFTVAILFNTLYLWSISTCSLA